MEITVKYDVLTYEQGKRKKIRQKYTCPDFQEKPWTITMPDGEKVEVKTSVLSQVDTWVEEQDKSQWMDEKDVHIIFDWEIVSAKEVTQQKSTELVIAPKKVTDDEMIKLFLKLWEVPEQIKIDFAAIYLKMKPSIKGLKVTKQIDIVLSSFSVAQKSAMNILDRLNEDMEKFRKTLRLE